MPESDKSIVFSQETASQAKKIAKESENSVRLAQDRVKDLERELSKVVSHRDELEETGDFANQESAKIKHMLLLGNYEHSCILSRNQLIGHFPCKG